MLEIPEASVIARQVTAAVGGKAVHSVVVGRSPHRFAFYNGDPAGYDSMLRGKKVSGAVAVGGMVEMLHLAEPCPACGGTKVKEAYLGGSVCFCPGCQRT